MSDNYLHLLTEATKVLNIEDVHIIRSNSYCEVDEIFSLQNSSEDFIIENKDQVIKSQELRNEDDPEDNKIIFFATLGVRWVSDVPESNENTDELDQETGNSLDDSEVCCEIEADYIAVYKKRGELTQDQLLAFASRNVLFNIWPYWREYVASQTQRMGIPKLVIPFYQPQDRPILSVSEDEE